MAINLLGLALGAVLTLAAVAFHFLRGTPWRPNEDISREVIEHRAESVPETEFAEPMNRAIGGGAAPAGVPAGDAGGELAEGETGADESPAAIPEEEVEYFEIEYEKEGETIEVASDETILEAGEDEGWDLPYACRQGQCVSCSGRIADGPSEEYVVHDDQQMLDEDELGDGYTLTCVAYPRDSFSIETGETP